MPVPVPLCSPVRDPGKIRKGKVHLHYSVRRIVEDQDKRDDDKCQQTREDTVPASICF